MVHHTAENRAGAPLELTVTLCTTEELSYLLGAEWEGEGGEGKGFSPRLTSTVIKYPFAL